MNHLPQLDAMRGMACLMVLIVHLKDVEGLGWLPDVAATAGVGLFFALSGFLITRILLADRAQGRGLNGFYNRRAARIFPIYYLTLALIALFWSGKELWWAATFTFNLQYVTGVAEYFHTDAGVNPIAPIAHFWSLCVEEHFYWVWPAIVAFTPARFYRWFPAAVIAATPLATWMVIDMLRSRNFQPLEIEGLVSRLTITQLVALSVGALTAIHEEWLTQRRVIFGASVPLPVMAGLVLISVSLFGWRIIDLLFVESGLVWQPLLHLACGGLFLLGLGTPWLGRLGPLARVGTISYGLYLYHLPIYAALGLATSGQAVPWWRGAAALLLTFAAAAVSYRILEEPILAWARRRQKGLLLFGSRLRLSAGTALTLLVFVGGAGVLTQAYRQLAHFPEILAETTGLTRDNAGQVDTIVLGTSHANNGVATPFLPGKAINLAAPGQDLYYAAEITEKCFDRLPRLQRVMIAISPFTFRYALSQWPEQRWREARYYHIWGIESRDKTADLRRYSVLAAAHHEDVNLSKTNGWYPREGILDPGKGEESARSIDKFMDASLVLEYKEWLIETIKRCQSRGVEVLLLTVPTHAGFRKYLDPKIVVETSAIIKEICERTGARFLDHAADPRFSDRDFFDPHHLNREGAIKFTAILAREVNH